MKSAWQRRVVALLCALCLSAVAALASAAAPADESAPPISFDDLMQLLDAGVTPMRAKMLVSERGVDFRLNEDVEKRLRGVGATDELLLQIAKSYRATAPPPAPPPAKSPAKTAAPPPGPPAFQAPFEEGRRELELAGALRRQLTSATPESQPELEQRIGALARSAIGHLKEARQLVPAQDANRPAIAAHLGRAYEWAGQDGDAAAAFEEAATLRAEPNYILAWGTALARTGKIREAGAACDRVATMDAGTASACWNNVGIVLYNGFRVAEALPAFRRATSLEPNNAVAWYLLAASLAGTLEFTRSGTKMFAYEREAAEAAFARYLAADPNGRFAEAARAAVAALQALRGGIETHVDQGPPTLRGREPPGRMRVTASQMRLLERPAPPYPPLARQGRVQGEVVMDIAVGKDGSVVELEAKSGNPLLYGAALDAVRKWRYEPYVVRRQPAEVATTVVVKFTLQQ
jgi:TonB family protein